MNFSKEDNNDNGGNFTKKEIYLGKALYKVVAVNPNKEELKALNQYVPDDEPIYTGKREIEGKEYDLANVTVYLQNVSNFDIIDRVTYTIVDNVQKSSTDKLKVINKYGSEAWLEESHIKAKTMPENMEWFVNEGIQTARRGEYELVAFIRALRNFKNITKSSTQEEKDKYVSQFTEEDIKKLFKGDFNDIKELIMSNSDLKVGFLLGARTADSGKVYQDIYKEYPLRKYMIDNEGSNEYIIKKISDAQENGRYANTVFDLVDLSFKKYDVNLAPQPDSDNFVEGNDHDDLPF